MNLANPGGTIGTPAPEQPKIENLGDQLVLMHACGHRLDEIMGYVDYKKIQVRLHLAGLLQEDGEPTALGGKAVKEFIAKRALNAAIKPE